MRPTVLSIGTLAGVFFFGWSAYREWGSSRVWAIIYIFFAVALPLLILSSQRAHDSVFGSQAGNMRDDTEEKIAILEELRTSDRLSEQQKKELSELILEKERKQKM